MTLFLITQYYLCIYLLPLIIIQSCLYGTYVYFRYSWIAWFYWLFYFFAATLSVFLMYIICLGPSSLPWLGEVKCNLFWAMFWLYFFEIVLHQALFLVLLKRVPCQKLYEGNYFRQILYVYTGLFKWHPDPLCVKNGLFWLRIFCLRFAKVLI